MHAQHTRAPTHPERDVVVQLAGAQQVVLHDRAVQHRGAVRQLRDLVRAQAPRKRLHLSPVVQGPSEEGGMRGWSRTATHASTVWGTQQLRDLVRAHVLRARLHLCPVVAGRGHAAGLQASMSHELAMAEGAGARSRLAGQGVLITASGLQGEQPLVDSTM